MMYMGKYSKVVLLVSAVSSILLRTLVHHDPCGSDLKSLMTFLEELGHEYEGFVEGVMYVLMG